MARNKYDIDETLETPFNIAHLKRALVYVKRYKWKMITAFTLSAISAVVALFAPLITKEVVDNAIPMGMNGDEKAIPYIILLASLFLLTIVVSVILGNIRQRIMTKAGQMIIYDIRKDLFKHLQELPFQYYDDRPQGKILVRVVNYVNNVSDMLTNGIINFVLEIFNIIFITVFMFMVDVRLALVIFAGVPVFILVMVILKNKQRRAWQQVSNKNSNQTAYLAESINCIRVTQSFARENENLGIFRRLSTAYRKVWMKAVTINHCIPFAVDNIRATVDSGLYFVGLLVIGFPAVSLGSILAMSNYSSRFWQPIINIANLYNNFINAIAYLERIFETMDEPVPVKNAVDAYELPKITGKVEFKNVTFAYEEGKNILENVSFTVNPGESVALVGPTGAGKTTIINLISRFYNINDGAVYIDGHDISKVTLHSLREQMGIMLQDSFIFSGSIESNIRYGKLDATEEEIINASKTVCAHDFIEGLEKGYQTEMFEGGSQLSGGQRQLVSFARTLISDPKILILDEATSSIDAKTEKELQKGLNELLKGRTSFIIAHRLSTIRNCDKIMFINNKGITEAGTHEELLSKKGDYYNLYMAQK
ncbi:MAG: ABC transporter ATP-binding protein [Ruminococcaceae bacterium]|nr:ABC transporter ATP-binding protein [Oscillospiraceae bacterium]